MQIRAALIKTAAAFQKESAVLRPAETRVHQTAIVHVLIDTEQPKTRLLFTVIRNISAVTEQALLCLEPLVFVERQTDDFAILPEVLIFAQHFLTSDLRGDPDHIESIPLEDPGLR